MTQSITRFDPFAGLERLRQELLDDGFFRSARGNRLPTTDVYTDKDSLVVEAHLPNFDDDDITVTVEGRALVIQAERHEREEDKGKKYLVRESSSSFYRSVALPDQAQEDKISASYDDGVLKVSVPLDEGSASRKIPIGTGDAD